MALSSMMCDAIVAHLRRLSSHNHKLFRALHQKAGKSVTQNRLDLICLFDSDADAHTVDTTFDEASLVLVPPDRHRIEQKFFARPEDRTQAEN